MREVKRISSNDENRCYILFDTHTQAMELLDYLKTKALDVRVAPAPREAKSSCGVSILCDCNQIDCACKLASENNFQFSKTIKVEGNFNAKRDKYL